MSQFWEADGAELSTLKREVLRPAGLELVFRADSSEVDNDLRPLDSDSGELATHTKPDGSVTSTDLASGNNTYTLTPPDTRTADSLMTARDWLVAEYSERVLNATADGYEVELRFAPADSRSIGTGFVDQAPGTDDWEFDAQNGRVSTQRVAAQPETGVQAQTATTQLTLFLTPAQARVIVENCQRVAATRVREVPDGPNVVEDNTTNTTNTLSITPPDTGIIDTGDYVVRDWSVTWVSDDYHRVELTIAEIA